jgi:glutathione S-transferase
MGKVPCIETPQGFLSETAVILDYLEECHPEPRLLPGDAFARAKVREVMHGLELYIELQARRHFRHVFFGEAKSQAAVDEARPVVENGLRALRQLACKGPWLCGDQFSLADIFGYHTFGYAAMAMNAIHGWDIVAEVPGLKETLARIGERPAAKKVDADQQLALQAFMAQKAAG